MEVGVTVQAVEASIFKILVGYDGSKPAREALRVALDLARHGPSAVVAPAVVRAREFATWRARCGKRSTRASTDCYSVMVVP
ncbi:MAG TPA: universal stress protein [bacterium]|nr:universal stress protein [bacterium]